MFHSLTSHTDCKYDSTWEHQDSVLHSSPCSASIVKPGLEPPAAECAGSPAASMQLLGKEDGRNCVSDASKGKDGEKKGVLGRMEHCCCAESWLASSYIMEALPVAPYGTDTRSLWVGGFSSS